MEADADWRGHGDFRWGASLCQPFLDVTKHDTGEAVPTWNYVAVHA
ncbi:hypothetical protein ACVWWO_003164 [Bradyrhizobium sp. F1.13.1]